MLGILSPACRAAVPPEADLICKSSGDAALCREGVADTAIQAFSRGRGGVYIFGRYASNMDDISVRLPFFSDNENPPPDTLRGVLFFVGFLSSRPCPMRFSFVMRKLRFADSLRKVGSISTRL